MNTSRNPRYPRTARVNRVVREIVADTLERLAVDDERLALLTVTGVETDPDLRHARVFYAGRHAEAEQGLEDFRVRLQAAIGREAKLKRTPQLSFWPDPAIASGARIEEILKDITQEDDNTRDDDDGH